MSLVRSAFLEEGAEEISLYAAENGGHCSGSEPVRRSRETICPSLKGGHYGQQTGLGVTVLMHGSGQLVKEALKILP
jgi:hypothetical protein